MRVLRKSYSRRKLKGSRIRPNPRRRLDQNSPQGLPAWPKRMGGALQAFKVEALSIRARWVLLRLGVHPKAKFSSGTSSRSIVTTTKICPFVFGRRTDFYDVAITRCFTLLYTLCLLTLLTRIQLNLLGRRNYLSSIVSASYPPEDKTIRLENRDDDNVEQPYGNDFETNRKFLTFSWWLLHRGWRDLMEEVQSAIGHVFGPVKTTEEIQFEQLSSLIINVRRRVEGETPEQRK